MTHLTLILARRDLNALPISKFCIVVVIWVFWFFTRDPVVVLPNSIIADYRYLPRNMPSEWPVDLVSALSMSLSILLYPGVRCDNCEGEDGDASPMRGR